MLLSKNSNGSLVICIPKYWIDATLCKGRDADKHVGDDTSRGRI